MCLVGFGLNSEITPRPPPQARSAPTQEPQRCSNYDFWCEQPFLVSSTYMYKPQIQRSDPSIEVPYALIDCASSVLTTSVAQILYFVLCLNVAMPRQLISRNGCPSTVYYWAAHDLSVYAQRELRARELSNSVEDALTMTEPCPAHGDFVVTRDADSFADTSPQECSPMDCSEPQDFGRPEACSFLQAGQEFDGTQRVSQAPANLSEDWGVQVSIEEVNWETGYVCGSMRAENVPQAKTPVVTFWEGDIIDNVNHSFVTSKWGAEKKVDVKHWKRFDGFQSISNHAEAACGRCPGLSTHTHIFMRWKEKKFVNVGDDCGLTIAGFYYICLSRRDGTIEGFYHDPHSSPYQRLRLKTLHHRYVSSHYDFQS